MSDLPQLLRAAADEIESLRGYKQDSLAMREMRMTKWLEKEAANAEIERLRELLKECGK